MTHERPSPAPAISMKTVILAAIYLAFGIGLGLWNSSQSFVGERLPTKPFLEYFEQLNSPDAVFEGPHLLVVNGETHDFGSLPLWAEREHTFKVRNTGNETLKLVMGKPTCSCTSGKDLKEGDVLEVPPGQERNITLNWEIRSSVVQFAQSAPFTTNDPKRKMFVLAIIGRVEDAVQRSRETVAFLNVPSSMSVVESVRLDASQTDKLSIVNHRFLNPEIAGFFDVTFEPPMEAEALGATGSSSLMARITLRPGMKLGPFEQSLELTTNMAPAVPPFVVPIKGMVVGDILVFGIGVSTDSRTVNLGDIPVGSGRSRTATVSIKGPHRLETTLKIKEVEPAILQVKLLESEDKPNVRLSSVVIEVPADAPLSNFSGTGEGGRTGRVVLETTHPTIKQIELQVLYVVRESG